MLTDRAQKDFKKWFSDYSEQYHYLEGWIDYDQYLDEVDLPLSLQQALIIEWLDSLKSNRFTIEIGYLHEQYYNGYDDLLYMTRQEATTAAIEIANKIYNAL